MTVDSVERLAVTPPGRPDRERPPGTARRERVTRWARVALLAVVAAVLCYLVLGPLALLLLSSLRTTEGALPLEDTPLSFENFVVVYTDPTTYELLGNTLVFAIGSLAIGLPLAVALAWLVERTDMPGRNVVFATILIPLAIPGMLEALGWVFLLDQRIGLLNLILRGIAGSSAETGPFNIYTLYGMFLVQGIGMVPTAFLLLSGVFQRMDPNFEDASRMTGRGNLYTLRRITLPLMLPATFAALIYFFVTAIEAFEVPGTIGLSANVYVFSSRIYTAAHPREGSLPDYSMASTLSILVVVIAMVLIWAYGRVSRNSQKYATITGKGYRARAVRLGSWKWAALGGYFAYLIVAVALPMFILVWASLQPFYTPPSLASLERVSTSAYTAVFGDSDFRDAVGNSVVVAVSAATVTMALVSVISWIVIRSRVPGRRVLDFLAFLPHTMPSIVMGLAILFVYLSFPNPVYGTVWIIVIAHVTKYLAFSSRTVNAGLLQIHPELEEASQVVGSSWWRTHWRIVVPLLLPVLVNGWLWIAMHSVRELSTALMLATPDNRLIGPAIWSTWSSGDLAEAAAMAVLLIIPLTLGTILIRVFVAKRSVS